ncbi:MAG: NAD(P)-binding protein, partial [Candidatus Bathyarchaeota archaeon]
AFNKDFSDRKAIYIDYPQAVPLVYTIDKRGIPPCKATCPAGMNVQGYIALIREGKYKEAVELMRRDMPFPAVCGRVCFHPCEAKCERKKVDDPIAIRDLKRFASEYELENGVDLPEILKRREEKVAIVGAGPGGLTAAYELVQKGFNVTVYEAMPEPGGMLRYAIPAYRLPKDVLAKEIQYIKDLGVEIKTNTAIGKDITLEGLKKDYDSVLIAIGTQKNHSLDVAGEETSGVIQALEFLNDANSERSTQLKGIVAVIGGGNVAIDAARCAYRMGAEAVHLLYRRSKEEMPAYYFDVLKAEQEGVKFHFLTNPVAFHSENGRISSVECIKMELEEQDESGRRRPVTINGSEYHMGVDTVILAIGQMPDGDSIPSDLEVTRNSLIIANEMTLETNQKGVFACGDIVLGPSTVINAIAAGKRAAESISRYLNGVDLKQDRDKPLVMAKDIPIDNVVPEQRQPLPEHLPDSLLGNFEEIELGFTPEMASIEANRCLSCGGCSECHECEKVCDAHAINHEMVGTTREFNVGAIILSPGAETFDPTKASKYGYGRAQNVVTSIEFERILSASGPFMGHVQRPSDGKLPRKIAFIQCVGSRDETCDNPYCSSVCCMYATKEAVIAKEHFNSIEPTIFYMDMRSYGKDFDRYIDRARDEHGVRFVRCRVSHTEEDPETKDIRITYVEGNEIKQEIFDLVVLSVGVKPSDDVARLSKRLGVRLNEYGFCETMPLDPLKTSRPGIFVSGMFSGPKDIP